MGDEEEARAERRVSAWDSTSSDAARVWTARGRKVWEGSSRGREGGKSSCH